MLTVGVCFQNALTSITMATMREANRRGCRLTGKSHTRARTHMHTHENIRQSKSNKDQQNQNLFSSYSIQRPSQQTTSSKVMLYDVKGHILYNNGYQDPDKLVDNALSYCGCAVACPTRIRGSSHRHSPIIFLSLFLFSKVAK